MDDAVELRRELDALKSDMPNMFGRSNFALVRASAAGSAFPVLLNGEQFYIPRDTLLSNRHVVAGMHGVFDKSLKLDTEIEIFAFAKSKLTKGSVFVDVGAMGGVISLPVSRFYDADIKVISFEPARNAIRNLSTAIALNGINNVELVKKAVSKGAGVVTFSEMGFTDNEDLDWLTQTSSIHHGSMDPSAKAYEVETVSLDEFFSDRADRAQVALIKIDVEGFEVDVIDGAHELLRSIGPALTIDIHKHPFEPGLTDIPIRERLEKIGYTCVRDGHVMLCERGSSAQA